MRSTAITVACMVLMGFALSPGLGGEPLADAPPLEQPASQAQADQQIAPPGSAAEMGPFKDLQDDGGSGQDASDTCAQPNPIIGLDQLAEGELFPDEDEADAWGVDVATEDVGEKAFVLLDPKVEGFEFVLEVWTPGCAERLASGATHGTALELTFTPEVDGIYTYKVTLALETGVPAQASQTLAVHADMGPKPCAPFCYSVGA